MQWLYLKEESLFDDIRSPSLEALSGHRLLLRCVTIVEQLPNWVISEPSGRAVPVCCDDGAAIAESNLSVPFSHIPKALEFIGVNKVGHSNTTTIN